ncbi:MAG TPA: iron ABC transporter permease, partial [Rhodocyclaceae bacterium]|nr:iron ABC transporter permease [Rhodocyclaceae bacterium]
MAVHPRVSLLTATAVAIAVLAAVPVASVGFNLFAGGTSATWAHLAQTVLADYVQNSLLLCLGVGLGVAIFGVATAWLTAMHEFPGRRFFEWALVLPLAMPAYVMAYVYTDFLQFVGPVQTALRETFGWSHGDYWFPDIRTLPGAVLMFVCVLYPYVYLLARNAFIERAGGMLEAARTLGLGPWRAFFTVSLPLARPAVATGVALALMETLADYGTVAYFAVNTFTTGIYRAWFSLGDRIASAQLAAMLLGFVLLLVVGERLSRGRARYHNTTGRHRPHPGARLGGGAAFLAFGACILPLGLGFLLPAGLLLKMALTEGDAQFGTRFLLLSRNSFVLAGVTAFIAVGFSLLLAYSARQSRTLLTRGLNRLVGMGYAVPGAVIAVGVLIPVTRLDNWLAAQWQAWLGTNPGLLLTGGIAALVYAYLVRFLAVALQTVGASLAKITPAMDDASRSLGAGQGETLRRVHVPILRGSLFTAG